MEQFPVSFPYRPLWVFLAPLTFPIKCSVKGFLGPGIYDRNQALAIYFDIWQVKTTIFGKGREPIYICGQLVPYLIFGNMSRPTDNRRDPHPSFEQAEFGTSVYPCGATAAKSTLFPGKALVRLKNNNGILPKSQFVQFGKKVPDLFIHCRDKGSVLIPRGWQVLIIVEPFLFSLQRVMGYIDRPIYEKRMILVFFQKTIRFPYH